MYRLQQFRWNCPSSAIFVVLEIPLWIKIKFEPRPQNEIQMESKAPKNTDSDEFFIFVCPYLQYISWPTILVSNN